MKKYNICNMFIQKDGSIIENYIITRISEYNERIKEMYVSPQLMKKTTFIPKYSEKKWEEPCQYGSHQVTGTATASGKEKSSILFKSGDNKVISDILFLYNFFMGGAACLEEDIDRFSHKAKIGINFGKYLKKNNINVAHLISDSLKEININGWESGRGDREILAFHFLLDAREPKSLNLQFIEEWICLALLCSAILNVLLEDRRGNGIFDNYVTEIAQIKKINFKLCLQAIRNAYIHNGSSTLRSFRQTIYGYMNPPICQAQRNLFNTILKTEKDFDKFKINSWLVLDYFLSIIFANILKVIKDTDIIDEDVFKVVRKYFDNYFC